MKNISDDKDHVNIIVSLLKDKNSGIEPNRESIGKFIDRTKITVNSITKAKLINSIMEKIGTFDAVYYTTLISKDFESQIDNISLEIPDVTFISSIFGPDKQDYITRTFSKLADSFIKNPTKKICVPYSISGATSSNGVIKYRTKVETEMKELLVMSHKIAELENKGHSFMNQINFVALPQLGNEIDNKNHILQQQNYIKELQHKMQQQQNFIETIAQNQNKNTDYRNNFENTNNQEPSIKAPENVKDILNRIHTLSGTIRSNADTQDEVSSNNDRLISETTLSENPKRKYQKKNKKANIVIT